MSEGSTFLLAHISDLHFSAGTDQSNPNHAHSIGHLIGLQERLLAIKGLTRLIVSGDVSNHGDRQSLITAYGWLFSKIPIGNGEYTGLGMSPTQVAVVPGNHDAWNARVTGPLLDRRQTSLENYNFAFPQHQVPRCGCAYDWIQHGDAGLYIALLDSCFLGDTEKYGPSTFGTLRYDQAIAKGRLTVEQTEQLLEWHDKGMRGMLEVPGQSEVYIDPGIFAKSLKLLVMHHYLFEPPEKKSDYFMRVQHRDIVFRNIALSDFDALLCGHKHIPSFDVHDYGDHFDRRARHRYMINYFRRLIGLHSLPIQFVDEKGRKLSKPLTQLAEIIGNLVKRCSDLIEPRAVIENEAEIADQVFELLKEGIDAPDMLQRKVEQFLHDAGASGASTLEPAELKAIQKRISVGLTIEQRKHLKRIADNVAEISRKLETRPFLQVMSGSSAKVPSTAEKIRSFHIYKIERDKDAWTFECQRYSWASGKFSTTPAIRSHRFSDQV